MKDNFIRLLAVTLLLLCLGATAKVMGQTTTANELAFVAQIADPHDQMFAEQVLSVPALDVPPAQTLYAVVEHMKVLPGKEDDYLKVEKIWKKIHQQRKAKGEIDGWYLFRCVYPGGTDARYEYITVTEYQGSKGLSAVWNWDELTKGLTKEEAATANDAAKTRNLIDRHLYSMLNGCGADCKPGKYVQLFGNKIKPGKMKEYEQFIEANKAFRQEGIKDGKIQAWAFWSHLYPNGPEMDDVMAVYNYDSLDGLLRNTPFDLSAEFKKVYPTKNFDDFMKQWRELREGLGSEMWEQVDGTE